MSTSENPNAKRITDLGKILYWLNELMDIAGASATLEDTSSKPEPVVVKELLEQTSMELDVNSAPRIKAALAEGRSIRLQGFKRGAKIVTAPVAPIEYSKRGDESRCQVGFPDFIEVEFRREDYRATLRKGLTARVSLKKLEDATLEATPVEGKLRDLSVGGCRIQLHAASASNLGGKDTEYELNLVFPSEESCRVTGRFSHFEIVDEDRIDLGIQFNPLSIEEEKRLMYFVREIERESVRDAMAVGDLSPSILFIAATPDSPEAVATENRPAQAGDTPVCRRLGKIASFLEAQALTLQNQGQIDGPLLSKNADRLLELHRGDSQELLFALVCLEGYSDRITHCIAVATRLVDIGISLRIPLNQLKAVAASAMIHEFAAYLTADDSGNLNRLGFDSSNKDTIEPELLYSRIENGGWISREIFQKVVGEVSERIDGSGAPLGLSGNNISELGKLAMVVDQVDLLQRYSQQGRILALTEIREYLSQNDHRFEPKWSQYYFKHFGDYPIGSYVTFSDHTRGWVRRTDSSNKPAAIVREEREASPVLTVKNELSGQDLSRLGEPLSVFCVA